ncbi:DNA double-strand break repair rad50 ATPase, putative (macronuclear) [Tetrahymena thermophila SB210]|uniref:DNA double-strand break repair rad50 ATPase, putative n=1 Tax=Tetrahymena thermophila (strain SB210) TaxID=312017 RepID=A4VDC6_TETTS|nr:DNA double-strand break repair rad50 ATPase, putative [Tetrahymena thermophila SB210]EDK31521.2 DNA double-strand break repair rad50 ATPase, putative [Tetrahymena thermophila SB210]|eukprot:XP_001470901.2 DNA double-strand break repair rad50 ATPase, putative [Tetrahymena thermophila SB210]
MKQNNIQMQQNSQNKEQNKTEEKQGKMQNQQNQQDSTINQQTHLDSNSQAQQQFSNSQENQQIIKPLDNSSTIQNTNGSPQKQLQNISKDDKIKMKMELMEKLKDLEGEIEQMEQEEENILQSDQKKGKNSQQSKRKTNPLQSNASSEEYVKRIKELEKERKTLKQRREERINQYEAALQEQLQKQKEEEILNKQRMKQLKKLESEKKLAEIEQRKKEREEKQKEEKQKIHDIKQQKPLYVDLAEKFSVQQSQELQEKKKLLVNLREISKPIDFKIIKQHQEEYDKKKKQKESSLPRNNNNNNEWSYEKPSYKGKIFEMYNNDVEHSKNNNEFKQKNAQQIVERRKLFSLIIKENFQPKHDPKKEQEFKEIQSRIHTQPRSQKNLDLVKAEGNEYLRNSIEKVKTLNKSNSQTDRLSLKEIKDKYLLNQNQQQSNIKLKSIQSSIQLENPSLSNLNISQISQNKQRQLSYHNNNNSGSSNKQNNNRGNEEINYGSNVFIKIQEDVNANKRSFETVDEKKKFFDYVQREYRKKLGSKYMESARYQNSHPQNLEDHIKEEVDKKLYKQQYPIEQKIQIVQNILKPYEEKAERDHRLLGIQQNDQQARISVADTYLSSIKAKLALINKIQTESYEALQQQKANQIILKVDNKSKRVSRKKKKTQYFDAEKINNIYAPSPKRNGSISPTLRTKVNQNQQYEQFSEFSPLKHTPQQTNRQISQNLSPQKVVINQQQINKDEKQSEKKIENQQEANYNQKNNNNNKQSQNNSYNSQNQISSKQNLNNNEKFSSQGEINNNINNQNVQKQEKLESNTFNNKGQEGQSPLKNQQNQNTKSNELTFSNQATQQNQVVLSNQSQQHIQIVPNNQEKQQELQKSKNSQSYLSKADREYLSKQQMQSNIQNNIQILEKIQSGQSLNSQQQKQTNVIQKLPNNTQNTVDNAQLQNQNKIQTDNNNNNNNQNMTSQKVVSNQVSQDSNKKESQNNILNEIPNKQNNAYQTNNIQQQNPNKFQINNNSNQNITPQKVVTNSDVKDSDKKEFQNTQHGTGSSNQKNQQNIQQNQSKVIHIQKNNDFNEQSDNSNNKKSIDINEFEQQKQQQNQNRQNVDQNILKKQFFSVQIQQVTNIKEKNPITYHIQIVDKNTVIKDLDGLNIDIEPLDLIVPEDDKDVAFINDTLEVNYDPKKMLKHYANRLQDIYIVFRIIQEKNQIEELIGWTASPLFKENQFNYGIFKQQLYLPPDIFQLPLEKSKYKQSYMGIQFKIFEGKL